MEEKNMVLLEGYEFKLTDFVCAAGRTTVAVCVSGNGQAGSDLISSVLEICPGDEKINIVSCEKRSDGGAWVPAAAQKTLYELTGDIGITGVLIEEGVGKETGDPAVEFRISFDGEIKQGRSRVAYISSDAICQSIEKLRLGASDSFEKTKLWRTPIEKAFCLYIVVPDGYKPMSACKANISITKRGLFLAREDRDFDLDGTDKGAVTAKTDILGNVKIIASVPLSCHQACGDGAYATACDCFALSETIGYTGEQEKFNMRDISICPKKKSVDLTLLNAHCGKSVYRLDGKYVIDCKRCVMT